MLQCRNVHAHSLLGSLFKLSYLICESEEKPVFSSCAFSSPSSLSTALFCSTSCLTSVSPWPSKNRSWEGGFPVPPEPCGQSETSMKNKLQAPEMQLKVKVTDYMLNRTELHPDVQIKRYSYLGADPGLDPRLGLLFINALGTLAVQIIIRLVFVLWAQLCARQEKELDLCICFIIFHSTRCHAVSTEKTPGCFQNSWSSYLLTQSFLHYNAIRLALNLMLRSGNNGS